MCNKIAINCHNKMCGYVRAKVGLIIPMYNQKFYVVVQAGTLFVNTVNYYRFHLMHTLVFIDVMFRIELNDPIKCFE